MNARCIRIERYDTMNCLLRLGVALVLLPAAAESIYAQAERAPGGAASAGTDQPAGSDKQADLRAVQEAARKLLAELNNRRDKLNNMEDGFVGKKGSATGDPKPPLQPRPQPQPELGPPVSAVVLTPAVKAHVRQEFHNASQTLNFAEQAFERVARATDPTVALADFRDGMSKMRQEEVFRSRIQSVVSPQPDQIRSVAPQSVPGGKVIVPTRKGLTFGSSTALSEAQEIDLAKGADIRTRTFESRGWSRTVEPVELNEGILTIETGKTLKVQPLLDALDKVPGTGGGTNFFRSTPVGNGEVIRADPKGVEAVNDPETRKELEKVGGVSLQVTLDLLSFYGVPEFRRPGPVKVVESPVLLSVRNLLGRVRPYAESAETWETLPDELRYPGSIERIHGFVLDDERNDIVFVASAARDARHRLDVDCLILGLRAVWRDDVVPAVSLDPTPGRPAGPQYSRVEGVPFNSTFARIMLDADYNMKRITFGDLDVAIPDFQELNRIQAAHARNVASRFWLQPVPLGPGDLHVSPTYRTILFESNVRCLTESQTETGRWSGKPDTEDEQIAKLFTEVYGKLEESPQVEPFGIYLRMHGLVDVVTAAKVFRDLHVDYDALREFVKLPTRTLSGAEATPRYYQGLEVNIGDPDHPYVISGGALLQSRLGRRSLDMYRDVTTMTLEEAAERFRDKPGFADRIDFSFCLPRATDVSGSRLELLYVKGMRAGDAEDYATARDCFAAVTREDPYFADAWADLAVAETMLGDHQAATEHVDEALRLEPDDVTLIEAEILVIAGALDARAEKIGQALADRENAATLRYLSTRTAETALTMLRRRGSPEEARKRIDLALELWKENGFAWYVRSLTWGDPMAAEALEDRQKAIAIEEDKVMIGEDPQFLVQVLVFDSQTRLDALGIISPDAIDKLRTDEKAATLAKLELGEITLQLELADLEDASSVVPAWLRAQVLATDSALDLELGGDAEQTERAIDEMGEAIEAADQAATEHPKLPDAHLAQAVVLMMCDRVRAKLPFLATMSIEDIEEMRAEIRAEVDVAIQLDASFGSAYMWRAAVHAAASDRRAAEADLAAAKRLNPKLDPAFEKSIERLLHGGAKAATSKTAGGLSDAAAARVTIALLGVLKGAIRQYADDRGTYPASGIEALAAALGPKGADSLQLTAEQTDSRGRILDDWGRPLVYRRTDDGGFRLYSLGPDGRDDDGAGDDVQLPDK